MRMFNSNNLSPVSQQEQVDAESPRTSSLTSLLRDRIVRHEIPPGSKLREQDLANEYGVPRTKVRDALAELQQRGLIERIPNRGAVVIRLDLEQVIQIYQVREVLEGLIARLATENSKPESWQDLVDFFNGPMEAYVKQGNYDAFIAGYELFRNRVLKAAANPILSAMIESIYEKTQMIIRRIIVLPGRSEQGLEEHRAVLAAMRRGDADEAERCRRKNMRSAQEFIRRYQSFIL
jgi:DNA-binding GntR family transcriptional regulator